MEKSITMQEWLEDFLWTFWCSCSVFFVLSPVWFTIRIQTAYPCWSQLPPSVREQATNFSKAPFKPEASEFLTSSDDRVFSGVWQSYKNEQSYNGDRTTPKLSKNLSNTHVLLKPYFLFLHVFKKRSVSFYHSFTFPFFNFSVFFLTLFQITSRVGFPLLEKEVQSTLRHLLVTTTSSCWAGKYNFHVYASSMRSQTSPLKMHGLVHQWWAGGEGDEEECGKLIGKHGLADSTGREVRWQLSLERDGAAGWRWQSSSSTGKFLFELAHRLWQPGSWSPYASKWWWGAVNWPHHKRCQHHRLHWTPAGWERSRRWSFLWEIWHIHIYYTCL